LAFTRQIQALLKLARQLGFKPVQSLQAPLENFNEVGLHSTYREWLRLMRKGVA